MGKKSKNAKKMNQTDNNSSSRGSVAVAASGTGCVPPVATATATAPAPTAPNPEQEERSPFRQMIEDAEDARRRGDFRNSAENYLEAYRLDAEFMLKNQSFRTYKYVFVLFYPFTHMLKQANEKEGYAHAKDDIKALVKEFVDDSNDEPSLIRSLAAEAAACLHYQSRNVQLAAELYRTAIEICNSATDEEKNRSILYAAREMKQVDELLSPIKDRASNALGMLTTVRMYNDRIVAGGNSCDACGKTREQLGVTRLSCCQRCGMGYYCSVECQRKQWKQGGHKQACRMPGQIEVGDIMKLDGLTSGAENMNTELARIIKPMGDSTTNNNDSDRGGGRRWMVQLVALGDGGPPFAFSADNLVHIRPAA